MKILGDSENFGKSWLIWKTWRKILENLEKLSKTQENSVRLMGINLLKILEYLVINNLRKSWASSGKHCSFLKLTRIFQSFVPSIQELHMY